MFYLFSCNVAEVLVLLVAGLAALPLPLAPLQLLWLNMVTDTFPALALALEPGDPDVMGRPPRDPQQAILSRGFFVAVVGFGLVITASTLVAFGWGLVNAPASASTMAFMTLALAQIGHLGNARSSAPVLRFDRIVANPYALIGVGCALALQAAAVLIELLAHVLRVVPLNPREWLVVIARASAAGIGGQAVKLFRAAGAVQVHGCTGEADYRQSGESAPRSGADLERGRNNSPRHEKFPGALPGAHSSSGPLRVSTGERPPPGAAYELLPGCHGIQPGDGHDFELHASRTFRHGDAEPLS